MRGRVLVCCRTVLLLLKDALRLKISNGNSRSSSSKKNNKNSKLLR